MYTYIYIYIYIYIHVYTYIHTYMYIYAVPAQALQPQDRRLVPRGKPPLSSCRFDSDIITLLFSTCHLWIVVKIL